MDRKVDESFSLLFKVYFPFFVSVKIHCEPIIYFFCIDMASNYNYFPLSTGTVQNWSEVDTNCLFYPFRFLLSFCFLFMVFGTVCVGPFRPIICFIYVYPFI